MGQLLKELKEALGHLVEAHEALDHTEVLDPTQGAITLYMVGEAICRADGNVRHALELLKEKEEERWPH